MQRALTPTLAIIVAGGLAAGIALARPANQPPAPAAAADGAAASEQPTATTDAYGRGGRDAGSRDGSATPADSGQAPAQAPAPITIQDFAFAGPATVAPGAAVTVTNADGVAHTLTFENGEVDTGTLEGGASTQVTAPQAAGTYAFFCAIHPSMQGELTVSA